MRPSSLFLILICRVHLPNACEGSSGGCGNTPSVSRGLMKHSIASAFWFLILTCTGVIGGCTNGSSSPTHPSATHFSVTAPTTVTAGTAFPFTVTVLDASNVAVTSYAGTIHFTSTDVQAVVPVDSVLTNGTANFSATLKTSGSQTLTATDTVTTAITGTSARSASARLQLTFLSLLQPPPSLEWPSPSP